jgi:hypothetical protein
MAVEAQQQGIVLTELEQRIFDRLLGAVDRYCPGTQLRVAGGWVRDKVIASSFLLLVQENSKIISFYKTNGTSTSIEIYASEKMLELALAFVACSL